MKIVFIADMDSIHSRKWIKYICSIADFKVSIINTGEPAGSRFHGAVVYNLKASAGRHSHTTARGRGIWRPYSGNIYFLSGFSRLTAMKSAIRMLSRYFAVRNKCERLVREIGPDVLHSLRMPIEGFLGGYCKEKTRKAKLALSTWGNDFTWHERRNAVFSRLTKTALKAADFMFSDCTRDLRLASRLGYAGTGIVLPGAGGIPGEELSRDVYPPDLKDKAGFWSGRGVRVSAGTKILFFIRGFSYTSDNEPVIISLKGSVHDLRLVFVGADNVYKARTSYWLRRCGLLEKSVFLAAIHPDQIRTYIGYSDLVVSPTPHDGLPNSLLETMAFGAIPVFSRVESIEEWVQDGFNAFLFDLYGPESDTKKVFESALSMSEDARRSMLERNRQFVRDNGQYEHNMEKAVLAYRGLMSGRLK